MKNNSHFSRFVGTFVIASILLLPQAQIAQAEMVTTESFLSQNAQTTPRDRVLSMLEKEEVLSKLQEFGVTPGEARERIASLSEDEINQLNQRIDQLPAGADAAGAILGTALAVFIILLITDILCWTKVFRFTRCAG